MKQKNKKGLIRRLFEFLTGIIIGGAVGSILGLSLAPKKGKETRDYLRDRSQDWYKGHSDTKDQKTVGFLKRMTIKLLMPKDKK